MKFVLFANWTLNSSPQPTAALLLGERMIIWMHSDFFLLILKGSAWSNNTNKYIYSYFREAAEG